MGRIDDIFTRLRADKRRGLMPFVCAGYPGPGALKPVLVEIERAGACIAEIGFPFSDPIADGPVIAAAMHSALGKGWTPRIGFDEIESARASVKMGLVGMVSVSIVWRLGIDAMIAQAQRAGLDGFIFPDLPEEEGREILDRVRGAGLSASLLIAPTTSPARAQRLVAACSGFVYLLARSGITGESGEVGGATLPDIGSRVELLRTMTDLPIACGFGISSAGHVRAVVEHADAAIVGSALVRRMGEATDPAAAAGEMVRELMAGIANDTA